MKLGIIGAGHAGVKAAETAAAHGAEVHLYSAEKVLPYYRPKLVGYAFAQSSLEDITMHDLAWYASRKIDLRLDTPVTACDSAARTLTSGRGTESYDAIIFSIGSGPAIPPFAHSARKHIHPLWHIEHAEDIRGTLAPGRKLVVIGGGILGVEVAHRGALAGLDVVLVERLEHLMLSNLCTDASEVVENLLRSMGVKILLGTTVSSIARQNAGDFQLIMESGDVMTADAVVLAVGARRDVTLPKSSGLVCGKGIRVDMKMQASAPSVFACGDIAEWDHVDIFCALEAVLQGKVAAVNALSAAQGTALSAHQPSDSPIFYSHAGFAVNSIGPACANGIHTVILEHSVEIFRGLLVKDGVLVGIQMAGSAADFRKYEKQLGQKLS